MNNPSELPVADQFDITIERAKAPLTTENIVKKVVLYPMRFLKKVYRTVYLIKNAELRKPVSKSVCPFRRLNTYSTLFFTQKITTIPSMMKAILKAPRKDPENGLFNDRENAQVFLPLLRDMYPNENVTADDFLLCCSQKYVAYYRQPILRFIGPQNIKKHGAELERIVNHALGLFEESNKNGKLNATEFAYIFTTSVISRLLLGHPGPFETYRKISAAVEQVNRYSMKRTWHQRVTEEEKKQYEQSLQVLRDAVETAFTTQEKPCFGSLVDELREDKQMTTLQIKTTLLLMYFAGSDTTSSLLNFILWQLGRQPEYQEEIYREIKEKDKDVFLFDLAHSLESVGRLFSECIRLFTPVYVIGRQPAADLVCTVKDKNGRTVFSENIPQKTGMLCGPTFAARDPSQYEKPDEFNPHRFESIPKSFPWMPFGDGTHSCPGQWLARAEVIVLVTALVRQYRITSSPKEEIPQKGYMTLKQDGEVWISFTKR